MADDARRMTHSIVYRVLPESEWQAALAAGEFRGSALDLRDGFIHFSTAEQVSDTLRAHYARQPGLVLLHVRLTANDAWRWEPSRAGALFPHLYAALPVAAVHQVTPLALGADGVHQLPELAR
jgi:uncharacterized protein (DUF952 family)